MNNYTETINNNQSFFATSANFLKIPNTLEGFINTNTTLGKDASGHDCYIFYGEVLLSDEDKICGCCGSKMYINQTNTITMKHLPIGGVRTLLKFGHIQLICSECRFIKMQTIPFKEDNHLITKQLKTYTENLLNTGNFTNKEVSFLTGINRNIVKEIDKSRLLIKYTINGEGKELIKPIHYSEILSIDEFKLHDGYKYATHIIDCSTGEILWIQKGKKKQVVYDFMNFVGEDWMKNVKAVACDMNSDFEEAFKEKYPHIKIVFDYFHLIKNFNDKVIGEIRKAEQRRLEEAGDKKGAQMLKRSRFILTSNMSTLEKRDKEALEGKVISIGSELFNMERVQRKGNRLTRYNEIINSNELFLIIELIKDYLNLAFHCDNEEEMAEYIFEIMELCEDNGNKHLLWFMNLLYNHFEGIIAHATFSVSSGKIEGINNKIKTLRRQAYGYPDDEYFFLKLFDMSRS